MLLVYQDSMTIDMGKPSEPLLQIQTTLSSPFSPPCFYVFLIGPSNITH